MIKILLVEDNADLNRFVATSLRNAGYDVVSACNGKDALSKTENSKCDLLLTDIMMPEINGFELAESIRTTDKTMPIIFMTAKDDKPSKMLGYNIGIDEYIKREENNEIAALIENETGKSGAEMKKNSLAPQGFKRVSFGGERGI